SGVVTLVSAGEATITATRAATSAYESVSASYALTVTALSPSTIAFADGATVNRLLGSGPYVNAVSGEGSGSLSYRSSVPAVAAVDAASGQVDVVGLGTTTISVDKAATATHASASASYTLIVTALPLSTIVFADGGSVSRTLGTGPYTNAVSGEGDGAISFESSSPAVASVDAATGEVTMVSQGTAVITASKAATATHEAASASYTLTVLSPSTIVFADGASVTRTWSTTLYINAVSGDGSGALSYASGEPGVATVDASSGEVSLVAAGSTVISVSKAATATHAAVESSYSLTVTKAASVISFADGTSVSRAYGSGSYINVVSGAGTGAKTYSSSETAVATVNAAGSVLPLLVGSTEITVNKAATATHAAASASYALTVSPAASTITFLDGTSVTKRLDESPYTNAVSGDGSGAVSYSSNNTGVATVASNGAVTLVSGGTAVITASKAATSTHASASASYTLTVLYPSTIVFADGASVHRTLGSGTYTNAVSGDGSGAISYSSSNPAVATVNASSGTANVLALGSTVITATKAATATHAAVVASYTLTVEFLALVDVPAGTFQRDSTPTNTAYVSAFRIASTELTRAQYLDVMGVDPQQGASYSTGVNDPVLNTNWYHAIAFCNKLSLREDLEPVYTVYVGGSAVDFSSLAYASIPTAANADWNNAVADWDADGYRLPTSHEWLWAAMGADTANPGALNTTGYAKAFAGSTGANVVNDYSWSAANSGSKTHPAGGKYPNEIGLYDMSGNVSEWCWDWMHNPYPTGALINYKGGTGSIANRICAGSSRFTNENAGRFLSNFSLDYNGPDSPSKGLRVVRNAE
ncbi:MAG TPA: SUMF1/EgtB/PvdO family nonheme iron enzyme, partial [Spirochaetales bacterium]|nr:SUMF1/EgtB/PvdO family nonheme iron enzyme [Spirochaetales bacterium]